jgi:hypothetical protein
MIKQFFRARPTGGFQARSVERDRANDDASVKSVDDAIIEALEKAKAERDGLKRRMDDVLARAAIVGGNDLDDHLTRAGDRSDMLRKSDADIRQGYQRLRELDQNIAHFERVQTALRERAPTPVT